MINYWFVSVITGGFAILGLLAIAACIVGGRYDRQCEEDYKKDNGGDKYE